MATFQSYLNTAPPGEAADYERGVLRDAMFQAQSNPQEAMQLAATNQFGQRGLPVIYRDRAMGRNASQVAQAAGRSGPAANRTGRPARAGGGAE